MPLLRMFFAGWAKLTVARHGGWEPIQRGFGLWLEAPQHLGDASHKASLVGSDLGLGSRESNIAAGEGTCSALPFAMFAKLHPSYFCAQGTCPIPSCGSG